MNPKATKFAQLSAFKQQAIIAILRRGGSPDARGSSIPYGLGIKRELEILRDTDVNHGRLYPNLDALADAGYVTKGTRDKRTNTYKATDEAVVDFAAYLSDAVGIDVDPENLATAPADALDKTRTKA